MRPVIFLDFDGVMNCRTTDWASGIEIDPAKVVILNDMVKRANAFVVLSSIWRGNPAWRGFPKTYGFSFEFLDRTPTHHRKPRGYEILQWLKRNRDLKRYAILDDDGDMLALQKPHFFQTSYETGLTQKIADAVVDHLLSTSVGEALL